MPLTPAQDAPSAPPLQYEGRLQLPRLAFQSPVSHEAPVAGPAVAQLPMAQPPMAPPPVAPTEV